MEAAGRPVQGHKIPASITRRLGQLLGICQIRSVEPDERQQPRAGLGRDAFIYPTLDALPVE